jgi:hypothetical protein
MRFKEVSIDCVNIGAKAKLTTSRMEITTTTFSDYINVGGTFPIPKKGIPDFITFMNVRFERVNTKFGTSVLEDDIMEKIEAIPQDSEYDIYIYISNNIVMQEYNTLIVVATVGIRAFEGQMFSISVAKTIKSANDIDELDTNIIFYTLDYIGYKEKLFAASESLTIEKDVLEKEIDGLTTRRDVLTTPKLKETATLVTYLRTQIESLRFKLEELPLKFFAEIVTLETTGPKRQRLKNKNKNITQPPTADQDKATPVAELDGSDDDSGRPADQDKAAPVAELDGSDDDSGRPADQDKAAPVAELDA